MATPILNTQEYVFASTVGPGSGEQSAPDEAHKWFILDFTAFPIREDSGTSATVVTLWAAKKGKPGKVTAVDD